MNKTIKLIVAMFVGLVVMGGNVEARPAKQAPAPQPEVQAAPGQAVANPLAFTANNACYQPSLGAFVVIDSIDCAVDVLVRKDTTMLCVGRFTTDTYKGRHDIKDILRPVSVMMMGNQALVLTSSKNDTSYLAVLDIAAAIHNYQGEIASLESVSRVDFGSNAYAFQISEAEQSLIVMGKNAVGYDIHTVSFANGLNQIAPAANFHYHVPKQAERIQESDPMGWGLAFVAIAVVFLALVCICWIMKGYGAAIRKVQDRLSGDAAPVRSTDDVYAAIAAAIYCYEQEQHDEEDTVITIQKVERAWTPWNAKFYNMNQFFSNRK